MRTGPEDVISLPQKRRSDDRFVLQPRQWFSRTALSCLLALSLLAICHASDLPPQLRRPVAMVLDEAAGRLYVACRDSGSVSIVDVERHQVVGECPVGKRLASLAAVPGTDLLLAVDEQQHEILFLQPQQATLEIMGRVAVAPYPVDIAVSADGRQATITSLWSRQLTRLHLDPNSAAAETVSVLDLPFAPRCQLLVRDDRVLIVADSFGGQLAVVDLEQDQIIAVHQIPGHNIRGLAVSDDGRMLVIAHQMLNELAHTVRNDVHWGLLMSNDLRWLVLDSVLEPESVLHRGAHMHPIGEPNSATADPSNVAVAANGLVVVTLGGVGELAVGRQQDFSLRRLKVGRRPVDLAITSDSKTAFVANMFDDSVSVVDLDERQEVERISLGPTRTRTLPERGEELFHAGRLSHDSWMSCNSCHVDGHTNGLLNDNLSDYSFGTPKRVLSLLGVADTAPFAWNGEMPDLETQIRDSIEKTMQSRQPARENEVQAIAAYLNTLPPPPSMDRLRGRVDEVSVSRGQELFRSLDCSSCHSPPSYTSPGKYDVGVHDEEGNTHFNPPSLLAVGQRGPYFHDNRAETLRDVFEVYGHQLDDVLTDAQLQDLLAFLRSL